MNLSNFLPGRLIQFALLTPVLASPALANLVVTAIPAAQTFLESPVNPLTSVTFRVFNNSAIDLILDYALERISPQGGDDAMNNTGASILPTFILAGATRDFTYFLLNPGGNPNDPNTNGLNLINFQIEMSPMSVVPTAATLTTPPGVFGQFTYNIGGSSTTTGPDAAVLAALLAAFNAGGAPANACAPLVPGQLYVGAGVVQGNACASVTVNDTPEPVTLWSMAIGCTTMGVFGAIRRRRAGRSWIAR